MKIIVSYLQGPGLEDVPTSRPSPDQPCSPSTYQPPAGRSFAPAFGVSVIWIMLVPGVISEAAEVGYGSQSANRPDVGFQREVDDCFRRPLKSATGRVPPIELGITTTFVEATGGKLADTKAGIRQAA